MTKAACVHSFFSSFGIRAYEESSVPDNAALPYLTYGLVTSSGGEECAVNADLWYGGSSQTEANAKTEEISAHLGSGGVVLPCDGGRIRIRRGEPFAFSVKEDGRYDVCRKTVNLFVMYLTRD